MPALPVSHTPARRLPAGLTPQTRTSSHRPDSLRTAFQRRGVHRRWHRRSQKTEEREIPESAEFRRALNSERREIPTGRNCSRRRRRLQAPVPAPSLRRRCPPFLAIGSSGFWNSARFGIQRPSGFRAVRDFAPFCWRLSGPFDFRRPRVAPSIQTQPDSESYGAVLDGRISVEDSLFKR